jgi:hypothetical protein
MSNKVTIIIFSTLIANIALYLIFHEFIQSDYFESVKKIIENDCGSINREKVRFFYNFVF